MGKLFIKALLDEGVSQRKIAKICKVDRNTLGVHQGHINEFNNQKANIMNALERLETMVNKPFLYRNEEVVFSASVREQETMETKRKSISTMGRPLVFNYINLPQRLSSSNRSRHRSSYWPTISLIRYLPSIRSIIQQLRDTVLQQIEAVKHNPEAVGQAKQVFQGVNTLINLAKTELEYRKFITNTDI